MLFIIVSIILILDQSAKFLANQKLPLNHSVPLIQGILHLTLVHNRGAAFGIFKNQVPLFIGAAIFSIILICLNLRNNQRAFIYRTGLTFILAGAIGNLIDRIYLGYVVDFIDFRIWPVFNIADSAITIGVVLLGWSILKNAPSNM